MRSFRRLSAANLVCIAVMGWNLGCKSRRPAPPPSPTALASANLPQVGGQKAVELRRLQSGTGEKPEFLSVTLLPGRGMNMFQLTAYLPGKGEVNLLASPTLESATKILNGGPEDLHGNKSFSMGGAFLVPFANRILGPVTVDKQTGNHYLTTQWHGRTIRMLANWHGKLPGAPWQAIHGDMLASKAATLDVNSDPDGSQAAAIYNLPANGAWFSDNKVQVKIDLERDTVTATITATNTGQQPEPVGIGWHPYFQLPSGTRANARLHIPALMRAEVNNYDDVFPTGRLMPVMGTPYDFNASDGAPLPDVLVDDSFLDLKRDSNGHAVAEIRDLGTNYGMRMTAMTPKIRAFQVYSPKDKSFIALEAQFNYGDPFGEEWHGAGHRHGHPPARRIRHLAGPAPALPAGKRNDGHRPSSPGPVMVSGTFNSVDEYIASQPDASRRPLQRVRSVLRKALPGAEETISYRIPAYKLDGRPVIYFAGWKQHYSLYPATGPVVATFAKDLAPYTISKGTIRFPLSQPVPRKLIEGIARLRAQEIAGRERTGTPKKISPSPRLTRHS